MTYTVTISTSPVWNAVCGMRASDADLVLIRQSRDGRTGACFMPTTTRARPTMNVAEFVQRTPRQFGLSDAIRDLDDAIEKNKTKKKKGVRMSHAEAIEKACNWAEGKIMLRLIGGPTDKFQLYIARMRGIQATLAAKSLETAPKAPQPAPEPIQAPCESPQRFTSATAAQRKLNELNVLRNFGHTVPSALIEHVTNELRRLERQARKQRTHLHH